MLLEQLKHLVELQILENRKRGLLKKSQEAPRRIQELETEFRSFEAQYLVKKNEYEHARKARRSLERDLADLDGKIARSKQRTNEVKTNKEYQALLKEIEDRKREMGQKEDRLLEIMESLESAAGEVRKLEEEVKARSEQMEESKEGLQREGDEARARIAQLEKAQGEVLEKLEPEILKRYRFLTDKGGDAVAPVQQGVCQVCYMKIPPQKFIELQRGEEIMACPSCHRFMYWSADKTFSVIEEGLGEV